MVGGQKEEAGQYDPYDPEESDDEEYEVSLLEIQIVHLVPLTQCIHESIMYYCNSFMSAV